MKLILSYSLFFNTGRKTNNLYKNGLLNNAKRYKTVFPDSTMVVYHDDTVDSDTLKALEKHDVVLKKMDKNKHWSGTLWRFKELDLIKDDNTIVLITDADTDIEVENGLFNNMIKNIRGYRGFVHHGGPTSIKKIENEQRWMIACAAMVKGPLNEPISNKIQAYIDNDKTFGNDERFLRDNVWSQIKEDVLISIEQRSVKDFMRIAKEKPTIFPKWVHTNELNDRLFTQWTTK